jgi:tyrosyl-tRNA synthetase
MPGLIDELRSRGLVHDLTDEAALNALPSGTPAYVGIDPTAPALTIGNLVPLIVALRVARFGMSSYLLFGGATGAIGDPSGRTTERTLLERDEIDENVKQISEKVSSIFERADAKVHFVNNFEWTREINILDFLRDVGKHFTVNSMLGKEVIKTRLGGEGISFTEFSYMLLQAYDFFHLYRTVGCRVQYGGSDQWGNITAGLDLIRKKGGSDAHGFSIPLLLDSSGRKFGKSTGGAVWIDERRTSPYRFHQFWLNVDDNDVARYLKIFTFLPLSRIAELEQEIARSPEKREAQRVLADEVCSLVHGSRATEEAKRCASVLFGGSLSELAPSQLEEIFSEAPSTTISRDVFRRSSAADLFAHAKLVSSKGEAKRLASSGGLYLNNERVTDVVSAFSTTRYANEPLIVLRSGKKSYHLVKITE